MKKNIMIILMLMVLGIASLGAKMPKKDEKFHKHLCLESPTGIKARYYQYGEGRSKMFIEKDTIVMARLKNVRPMSWHPKMDILLVKEDGVDDDNRCYLLNIGEKEFSKGDKDRQEYVFGSRYVNRVKWSKDGTKVILISTFMDYEKEFDISKYTKITMPEKDEGKKEDKKDSGK